MTIAEQVEHERLLNAGEPDAPANAASRAVIDLAAEKVLVKTLHAMRLENQSLRKVAIPIERQRLALRHWIIWENRDASAADPLRWRNV